MVKAKGDKMQAETAIAGLVVGGIATAAVLFLVSKLKKPANTDNTQTNYTSPDATGNGGGGGGGNGNSNGNGGGGSSETGNLPPNTVNNVDQNGNSPNGVDGNGNPVYVPPYNIEQTKAEAAITGYVTPIVPTPIKPPVNPATQPGFDPNIGTWSATPPTQPQPTPIKTQQVPYNIEQTKAEAAITGYVTPIVPTPIKPPVNPATQPGFDPNIGTWSATPPSQNKTAPNDPTHDNIKNIGNNSAALSNPSNAGVQYSKNPDTGENAVSIDGAKFTGKTVVLDSFDRPKESLGMWLNGQWQVGKNYDPKTNTIYQWAASGTSQYDDLVKKAEAKHEPNIVKTNDASALSKATENAYKYEGNQVVANPNAGKAVASVWHDETREIFKENTDPSRGRVGVMLPTKVTVKVDQFGNVNWG